MSDTQSIYKFVLGLNETGGTDDHQLIPSSWVYGPIKIISNHPNDVKTSGLQPPSSSSTLRRISYSEWDKPGLSE